MAHGRHTTTKPKTNPTYNEKWSGVSYMPHSSKRCEVCAEQLHEEGDSLYCPTCDDYRTGR